MGGHGGLNILPQKRWNVYNYENREKVRKDEAEQAAREQALAEEQRRRDSELRLQTLRTRARQQQHLPLPQQHAVVVADSSRLAESLDISTRDSVPQAGALKAGHINLFEGLDSANFSALACGAGVQASDAVRPGRALEVWEKEHKAGEEEKHRLGYGAVGKGGQQPWYARAGDLTVGEEEGVAGKIKGDAGGRGVGKRRLAEAAEVKTDSQRVNFQAPQKSDSEREKKVGSGEEIHPAKDEDRDDNGDDHDERISSPRHKKKRKHRRRRSVSPDSPSSTSRASSGDDDDANHRGRRGSRTHRKKQRIKAKNSFSDRSSSESPSSSSDSDSDRGVRKKKQRSRRRSDSPDSSSSSSLASSYDDDADCHHHRRSRKHHKKHHTKRRFSSTDRSPSESPSSSSSDSDSDRQVGRRQGSRRRHRHSGRDRSREKGGQRRLKEREVGERQERETRRGLGATRGREARNERGTGRRKRKDAAAAEGMRCEVKGAAAEQGKKSIEALRAERVAREARERERAQMLLLQHHQAAGGRGLGGALGSGAAAVGSTSGVRQLGGGVEGNGLFGGIVMHGPETRQRRKEARYNSGFGYGR